MSTVDNEILPKNIQKHSNRIDLSFKYFYTWPLKMLKSLDL